MVAEQQQLGWTELLALGAEQLQVGWAGQRLIVLQHGWTELLPVLGAGKLQVTEKKWNNFQK